MGAMQVWRNGVGWCSGNAKERWRWSGLWKVVRAKAERSGLDRLAHTIAGTVDDDGFGVMEQRSSKAEVSVLSLLKISGQCLNARLLVMRVDPRS